MRYRKFEYNYSATLFFIVADFYIKNNFFAKNVVIFRKNAVYIVKSSLFFERIVLQMMEIYKKNEILLAKFKALKCKKDVITVKNKENALLNSVYKEIADNLGIEAAMEIFRMFNGQQITFPVRFLNSTHVRKLIIEEYDGTNIKQLAQKYSYSEKTVRRILKESETVELK